MAKYSDYIRALLLLGRVSNLPTVWSNCLAGWLLGGLGESYRFNLLCLGATCLYLGGVFLNDAFDVGFDRRHRRRRPIPAGMIDEGLVWRIGGLLLVIGVLVLCLLGGKTAVLTLWLAAAIVLYNWLHKRGPFSPLLMALCRFLLYLVAASVGMWGVMGLAVWCALALACYVVGLSYIARKQSLPGPLRWWPLVVLGAPVLLAWVANAGEYQQHAKWLMFIFGMWTVAALNHTFGQTPRNAGRSVSWLLAGMVWVDLLAVAGMAPMFVVSFVILFCLTLALQRVAPAT
jgi:4-hydroxybenzoate polyprenyltransferase